MKTPNWFTYLENDVIDYVTESYPDCIDHLKMKEVLDDLGEAAIYFYIEGTSLSGLMTTNGLLNENTLH